jgi:ceramide glucosyltransferase
VIAWAFTAILVVAALYQIVAIIACLRQLLVVEAGSREFPGVSVLKPVRGLDPSFYAAIRSQAAQDYPGPFEILFGVANADDPATAEIKRLQTEFPNVRLIFSTACTPNTKVAVLCDLDREALHPLRVVNDSDIRVRPDYLRRVLAPLSDSRTGLVTCLYRAHAGAFPGRWEALGVGTDFVPSTLVAPLVGVNEFGMGSTLAFRAADLARIGGFAAVADYIADDYQIGKKISGLGLRVHLSKTVVDTTLGGVTWRDVWLHQVRWARTIRVSRGGGYIGLPVTHASLWALVALCCGWWWSGLGLLGLRYAMGLIAGLGVLRCGVTARMWPLIPLRDLWGSAVWAVGLVGNQVVWRDRKLRLAADGRIAR